MNAWEQRQELGLIPALFETIKTAVVDPSSLFENTPRTGGIGNPLLFAVIIGTSVQVVAQIWQMIFGGAMLGIMTAGQDVSGGEVAVSAAAFFAGPVIFIILSPVLTLIGIFIGSGLIHLGVIVLGGNKHGFEATFRGMCYAQGVSVFGMIPICGGLIASIWVIVLNVIGISKLQEIEGWKALLAIFLFPCVIIILMAILGVIAAIVVPSLINA